MGKTWVRCGNNRAQNSRVELPSRQKRNFHVWTRETHSTSQPADPVKSEGLQSSTRESDRHRPAEAPGPDQSRLQNHSSAEDQAAKRRRLIAKGRYVQDLGSQSQQTETKNGGQAISQPSLAEQAQKEKQEKLQRETEALRRRIAEEEAKMLAAKARFLFLIKTCSLLKENVPTALPTQLFMKSLMAFQKQQLWL